MPNSVAIRGYARALTLGQVVPSGNFRNQNLANASREMYFELVGPTTAASREPVTMLHLAMRQRNKLICMAGRPSENSQHLTGSPLPVLIGHPDGR